MNILFITNYFIPEIGAASHLYYYLAKELIKRNHKVFILTGIPRYNVGKEIYSKYRKKEKVYIENLEGIEIIRVELPLILKNRVVRRGIEYFEVPFKLYKYSKDFIGKFKIDVSLIYSPPLSIYWVGKKLKSLYKIPFILNVQDIHPQALIDLGIMKNRFLINFFRKIEKDAYESADLITVHSEKNKNFIKKVLGNSSKIKVVENWIDENEIKPGLKKNEFSCKYNLCDKFVVSFAGTLGTAQDIKVILEAAKALEDYKDIIFLVVGDGIKKELSLKIAKEKNLKNVIFLPMQPKNVYSKILHSSDVSLATLEKEVKTPVVPSKILSIMSAGIPVIATMNLVGDAPKLIKKAKCGYVFDAGDYKSLAKGILELYQNEKLRKELGKNGRKYIEEHLSVKVAADTYEKLFEKLKNNI